MLAEIDAALPQHELIKVKFRVAERGRRKAITQRIRETSGAALIRSVGHGLVPYREKADAE